MLTYLLITVLVHRERHWISPLVISLLSKEKPSFLAFIVHLEMTTSRLFSKEAKQLAKKDVNENSLFQLSPRLEWSSRLMQRYLLVCLCIVWEK